MEKVLKAYIGRYGSLRIPLIEGIKSITGECVQYYNDGECPTDGPYFYGNYIMVKYDYVAFTIGVDCPIGNDDLGEFEKIELTIIFLEEELLVKYQAYIGSSVIEETRTVPRMTEEYLVVFENEKIPYIVNFQLDYPYSDYTIDEQFKMTLNQ